MMNHTTATETTKINNPCDHCGADIFPRVRTRLTGAKCLNCCTRSATVYTQQICTAKGYQSVAAIVVEMQTAGTAQILIDRWLQGLGR